MEILIANQSESTEKHAKETPVRNAAPKLNEKSVEMNPDESDFGEFDKYFREYYRALRAYAFRFVNDLFVAEDIVQDVFMKLWEKRDKLDQINSIRSYLFTSVYNGVQNFIKHKKIEETYQSKQSDAFKEIEHYYTQYISNSAESLIALELERKITEVINTLPEQCKNVFILSRMRGLKNQEIADYLGVTIKAVEKQMTSALKVLRFKLKDFMAILLFCLLRLFSFIN